MIFSGTAGHWRLITCYGCLAEHPGNAQHGGVEVDVIDRGNGKLNDDIVRVFFFSVRTHTSEQAFFCGDGTARKFDKVVNEPH